MMKEKWYLTLLLGSLFLFELILSAQGFCMADEGWTLSGAQQIFRHPESVEYQFLFYNGIFVGGLWNLLFADLGYWGFRLLNVLFMMATWGIIYSALRPRISRKMIGLGFLTTAFAYDYGLMVFDHSSMVVLLTVSAMALLVKALENNRYRYALISGILLGINIFSKLTAATSLALVLCLIPYYIYERSLSRTLKMLGAGILGVLCGAGAEIMMMMSLGHWEIFLQSISSGMSAATSSDSSHNLSSLLSVSLLQHVQVVKDIMKIFLIPAFSVFVWRWLTRRATGIWVKRAIAGLLAFVYAVLIHRTFDNELFIYAFLLTIITVSLVRFRHDRWTTFMATASLTILIFLPFGSDFYILNMGVNAIWLPLPFAIGMTWKWLKNLHPDTRGVSKAWAALFLCLYLAHEGYAIATTCYFDPGPRWQKTCRVNHPLATTFTTKEYAEETDKVLSELQKYVQPNDTLFVFQSKATLHYLTQTVPYMYNPWPWSYDTPTMAYNLQRAEARGGTLPVLVREKTVLQEFTTADPDWDNANGTDDFEHKNAKIRLIQDFIKRHQYQIVWESSCFQILVSRLQEFPQKTVKPINRKTD